MIKFSGNQLIRLIQNEIRIEELKLGFVQLNKGVDGIDIFEIIEIYVDNLEKEG